MKDLSNFLVFLEENDTTLSFSKKRIENSFRGLVSQLNKINTKMQLARIERERQYHYLQAIVGQIDTGIISYDQQGRIGIFNRAAMILLGIRQLKNITDLCAHFPELSEDKLAGKKIYSSAVKIIVNGNEKVLSVKVGAIKLDDQWIRILSLQNIKSELQAGELDAWRKLIRIQRHEIVNSLTPISTLTTAIKRRFLTGAGRKPATELTDEHINDALECVEVIEERSKGLIAFMESFRGITDLPRIEHGVLVLSVIFNNVSKLFEKEFKEKNIEVSNQIVPHSLVMQGDAKLLEQVLINLVKNSIEAIKHAKGKIRMFAFQNHDNIVIQVTDNGMGIPKSDLDSIFVPSYTTKNNGSGIGLSISRQIVQLHKGTIEVRSASDNETTFEIILPARL
jgi:nitrogen fixation/metabolism regulation signal transduction histidine kinase